MTAKQLMTAAEIRANPKRWHNLRQTGIGASEVAAMLGICPPEHGSPFALFVAKTTGQEMTGDADALVRGRHLEAYVADRWQEQRSDLAVLDGGLYASGQHDWMMATFDRLCLDLESAGLRRSEAKYPYPARLVSPAQIKTWASHEGWGEPGTDQIPDYIRAQCLQEMTVWEAQLVLVPVLFIQPWKIETYLIERDEDAEADIKLILAEEERFMNRLADNDPPDVDWTPATTRALRTLHPAREGTHRIKKRQADEYKAARRALRKAERRLAQAVNDILAESGGARSIVTRVDRTRLVEVAQRRTFPRGHTDAADLKARFPEAYKATRRTSDVDALYASPWASEGR